MHKFFISISAIVCIFSIYGCGGGKIAPETNLPNSREANLIEVVNPCEWMVRATGIGSGSSKERERNANIDAGKAAVHFILFGGTDPLIQNDQERMRFSYIEEDFFEGTNYRKYISWENTSYDNRVRLEQTNEVKITKSYKINRCQLNNYLGDMAVIEKRNEVLLQMPMLAVLPRANNEQDALEIINSNPNYLHAATVIKSFLTNLKYDAIIPKQKLMLDEIEQFSISSNANTDNAYLIANSIGCDIYVTFAFDTEFRLVAGTQVAKVISTIDAYETTTGRLLGSETGYSEERPSSEKALIEESINDAIAKVLTRIDNYWKKDVKRGIQYRLIFNTEYSIGKAQKENALFTIIDIIKENSNITKEEIVTDNNMKYLVWVDPEKVTSLTDFYRILKTELKSRMPGVNLQKTSLNRKMGMFKITE